MAKWGAGWGARWSVGERRGGELRRLRAVPALAGVHWVCIEWEDSVVVGCWMVHKNVGSLSL